MRKKTETHKNKENLMSNFPAKNTTLKAISIVFLISLFFVGCSNSPVSNLEDNSPTLLSRSISAKDAAQLSASDLFTERLVSAEYGGVISLFDVTIEVPPGALDSDTLFFIKIPDITVFYNEFGTHGLYFNKPVKVTMSYRDADLSGINESTIRIGWFNPTENTYQDVECTVDFENKEVTGYLNHFSAYALISD